jgi:type I restriction enzyme S subunit
MRDGWIETSLGEVAEVVGGGTPSTTVPEYWNGDIVWLTPTEITAQDGRVITDSIRKISKAGFKNSGAQMLPKESVILTSRASVGYVALSGIELCTNQGFQSLIPKRSVMAKFLMYWIQQNKAEFESRSAGSTFKEISKSNVKSIKLALPPYAEQKRIVDLISSVDSYIEALHKELNSAKIFRNALLHELLTAGGEGWVELSLGELTENTRPICYGVLKPGPEVKDGIPLAKITDMNRKILGPEGMQRISIELDNEFRRSRLQGGEVLLSIQGTVGRVAIADSTLAGANISRTIALIDPDDRLLNHYLMLILEKIALDGEFDSAGSTRESLNISTIRDMKISCPPLEVQNRTIETISTIDKVIDQTDFSIVQSKTLRSSLLSNFLSGNHEIPVSYDEVIGAA